MYKAQGAQHGGRNRGILPSVRTLPIHSPGRERARVRGIKKAESNNFVSEQWVQQSSSEKESAASLPAPRNDSSHLRLRNALVMYIDGFAHQLPFHLEFLCFGRVIKHEKVPSN
jgi:hypothetical protein